MECELQYEMTNQVRDGQDVLARVPLVLVQLTPHGLIAINPFSLSPSRLGAIHMSVSHASINVPQSFYYYTLRLLMWIERALKFAPS